VKFIARVDIIVQPGDFVKLNGVGKILTGIILFLQFSKSIQMVVG
jgi:hypothetical protein